MSNYDYDAGEVTDREWLAAQRQKEIANNNADAVRRQLNRQIFNYDIADEQNRRLADVQLKQVSRKNEADRFEAQRNLQNAALGLFGSMNQAMNGSTVNNMMRMLENRNDSDNSVYWQQLMDNKNAITNALEESKNQNEIAKNDARINAEKALYDLQSDLAANLSNINPNLFESPGTGGANLGAGNVYTGTTMNTPKLSGYIMPENSVQNIRGNRNTLLGNDYFSQLVNKFNRR